MTDDAADVVRRRQVTAEGDAENFEREVTGDARQQRRRLDLVTSAAVMEDDFLRLGSIQHQIGATEACYTSCLQYDASSAMSMAISY